MTFKGRIAMVVFAFACATPAHAGDGPEPLARADALLDPRVLLQGVIREDDVSLLFAYFRAALMASYEGREASAPEELARRAEAIAAELKSRGALAGLLLLTAFETAARQALREALSAPVSGTR